MYKYEMHCHTGENDHSVSLSGAEIVDLYAKQGYDGLVITNHFGQFAFDWYKEDLINADKNGYITRYLKGYHIALERGKEIGLNVILGIELRFDSNPNDYLIYGIDENFLYNAPLLCSLSLDELLDILPESAVVYQAHPFRKKMMIEDHKKLFGIEVYNGNTLNKRNYIAKMWAEQFNLHGISGSDFHRLEHLAKGGCAFDKKIIDSIELASELKSGNYKLIIDGDIAISE